MLSITSSNISHLTVNNNNTKTKYDMFIDDEEHRSSCESGNYNEEFSSTRFLIKNSENSAYLDTEDNDEQIEDEQQQFTRDQLDSFILNPNRQLNKTEPEYFISSRDSRVNYENEIDDEFRQNESSSESSTSCDDYEEEAEISSENSDYYENSDSEEARSTADSLTSSEDELIDKKNDSQFVGHFDGSKPLISEDEDYDEEEQKTKEGKLIDIEDDDDGNGEENLFENETIKNSINYIVTDQANTNLLNQSNRSNLSNLSNQSQDELDKEVASNLFKQVEQDKLRNKDLFGSKPFNQETREALKCKLNLETNFDKDKLLLNQQQQQQTENLFSDNQFNKMNLDQIKLQISTQLNQPQPQHPTLINQVSDSSTLCSSTLSAIASTLIENQDKLKKENKYQLVKLPNVIKKQQAAVKSKLTTSEQPQLTIEQIKSKNVDFSSEDQMMASPSTLFDNDSESNLKVIKSTKSSKLPSSIRHKDEKHLKAKVKLHKSKLNPSKLKSSQKSYKGIEEYDDDVDELLSNDQDDLSQVTNLNKELNRSEKSEKSIKKKLKDKEKDKEKSREKKDKKHKEKKEKLKEEKRLKKESKKANKNIEKPSGFGFANMSFEEMEETR